MSRNLPAVSCVWLQGAGCKMDEFADPAAWRLTLRRGIGCGYQVVVQDLGISPMHVILTNRDTLIHIDRSDVGPTPINTSVGVSAYSVELNIHTLEICGLEAVTNTLCSAGHSLPNVRRFDPCLDGSCDWIVNQTMGSNRWYPSSIRLPNGNIAFLGG
eukprot:SM000185S04062  [mRNA]  locus=s185:244195:244890:- [translate_table: standard]